MLKEECNVDQLGQKFGETYLILSDPNFERRLKSFDPLLKLMFDQRRKRWCILEWENHKQAWRLLLVGEDPKTKEPKAIGEWCFVMLDLMKRKADLARRDPNAYWKNLMAKAEQQANKIESNISDQNRSKLIDDRTEWRKAARELRNLPKSDVTAGYPKSSLTQQVFEGKTT